MSFFSNINTSPVDTLRNKIEHVRSQGIFDIQKTDNSLIITYAPKYTIKDITRIEIPYNWFINKIFDKGLNINNINKIEYRSMLSFGEKNNQLIKDIHLTFYKKDKAIETMLLSQNL